MEKYAVQPLDLMQFINTKYHEPFIHERIELDGNPDAERLAESVNTLAGSFPLLKCHYDVNENIFIPAENFSVNNLLEIKNNSDKTALLTESLDMREQLIKFTISDNILYITVSHLVCDGSGFKQLLYLLCDIYNDNLGEDYDCLMERNFSQLTKNLNGNTGTLKMLLSMMGKYKNFPVYAKSEPKNNYLVEKSIPKEIMAKVHTAAKNQGATLNDVFLTAYARTLNMLYGAEKINIPCTVDLRKYAKEKTGIANLTGTYNLNVKIKNGEKFGETLSAVNACMRKQKKTRNDIAGPALLVSKYEKSSPEDFLKLYGNMDTSQFTDYTNLGVLDAKKLSFNGTAVNNAVGYSVLSKAPCFQIAVSSFKGETTFSALFQSDKNGKEKAEKIVLGIVSEIADFD